MATKTDLEKKVIQLTAELEAYRNTQKVIDIIYPNVAKFAQWEELKYSLRSLEKNLTGISFKIWIVGDFPEWAHESVNHIPCDYSGEPPRIDILHKHLAIINHPDIGEEYFWMNDDIYLVNKVMYADMCLPVAVNNLIEKRRNYDAQTDWGRDNLKTLDLLIKHELTTLNYAAHIPHRYEKSKVKFLIEEFGMLETPIVLEQLYYNYWFKDFLPYWDTLDLTNNQGFCINRQNANWRAFDQQIRVKKYLNNSESGMSDELKNRIMNLFPNKSQFEKTDS